MRSMALGANIAKSKSPLAAVGSLIRMPSIMTSVWPVLAPRRRILVVEPGPPVSVISSPGTVRSASTSEPGLLVASVSLLTTLIALPIRLSGSGVLLGVTTSSEGCGGGEPGLFVAGTGRLTGLVARLSWIANDRLQLRGQLRHWGISPHRSPVSPSWKAPMTIAKKHNAAPNSNPPLQVVDGYLASNSASNPQNRSFTRGIPAQIVRDVRDHGLRFMSASDVSFRS